MKKISFVLLAFLFVATFISCQKEKEPHPLQVKLQEYIDSCQANIGVAVILPDSDTIVVNDGHYPMNSVVKLFQDLPSAYALQRRGKEITDSVWVNINDLYKNFYSPMLEDMTSSYAPFTWQSLFEYALAKSDNNASNLLFMHLAPADSVVAFWNNKGIEDFDIKWDEAQIHQRPSLNQENWTSPLAAARVISYTAPMSMVSSNYTIAQAGGVLMHCETGENRISKPLNPTNAIVCHKTGTGFDDNQGRPTSLSDVAYIILPSGKAYTLSVFVTDSQVGMEETEAIIANISQIVLQYLWDEADQQAQDQELQAQEASTEVGA